LLSRTARWNGIIFVVEETIVLVEAKDEMLNLVENSKLVAVLPGKVELL
jgi:hypothetical protein